MGVGDVLSSIGSGLAGVGKAAGRAVQEFGPEIGTALRGDAGEVAYEQRQQQYSQEEKQREIQADELERQLDAGRRYGTLNPQQQQQLVQQITSIYPKAQHAPRLMDRLRRIAKGGAAQGSAAPLQGESLGIPTAFPPQGTLAVEAQYKAAGKPMYKQFRMPDGQVIWADVANPPEGAQALYSASQDPEVVKANQELRQRHQELDEARFKAAQDPNSMVNRAKMRSAQAAATRAEAYMMRAQAGVLGTYQGKPLPGAVVDAQGQPVGGMFQTNVRPTGVEVQRADLATSALDQMDTMGEILLSRPDLFGPASGRKTNLTQWLGSQDPDAQRFSAAARVSADHLAGVFGGRSEAALEGIYKVIGENKTNPEAAIAALDQMSKAAGIIQARGTRKTVGGIPQNTGQGASKKKGGVARVFSPPPAESTVTVPVGAIAKHKDGTRWRFKGGDSSDVKNWEQVK